MTGTDDSDDSTALPTMRDLRQSVSSRRQVLAGSGAVLGAGVLASTPAFAQDDGEEEEPMEIPDAFDEPNTDTDVLAYALTLERLEDAFYQRGLEDLSDDDLIGATVLEDDSDFAQQVPAYFETVSEHETVHTEQLVRVLDVLGAEVPDAPTFAFEIPSAEEFLATAQVLENTGVGAYAGAAPRIESPDILSAALSIHSVEARHAATLNLLNGESPFPNAFDPALTIPEVLEAIQPFIVDEDAEEPTGTPTETPGNGTSTPSNGTSTPSNGTDTPGSGTPEGT